MAFSIRVEELVPLVELAMDGASAYAGQFGVVFWLNESVPGARVKVDPDRLHQVLTNLLSNAAKYSPRNSTVEVSVKRASGRLRVSVRDFGPGIPEEFRPRLFEKFAQADGSDTRQKGGTGLGLSISKNIIQRLGGILDFRSEMGEGTTFFFELPELEVERGSETPAPDPAG
jgi:signal transduction histidine kinase